MPYRVQNCSTAPTRSQVSTEAIPQHAVYPALSLREQGGGGITAAAVGGEISTFNSHDFRMRFPFFVNESN